MITKIIKHDVQGILLLDKPHGVTSNVALQIVKRLFNAKKAGHTGSLDPLATGMLPICFGQATKFSQFLLDADKTYWVRAKLGIKTTTSDAEGEIISEKSVPPLTASQCDELFSAFRGRIQQVPSMYSALKYQGQPLYRFARKGQVIERSARDITIYQLEVLLYQAPYLEFTVRCSKGTYVRTLVDDFGELLGCGAHVAELRRIAVGNFSCEKMVTISHLQNQKELISDLNNYLLPTVSALSHLPCIALTASQAFYLGRGQPIIAPTTLFAGLICLMQDKSLLGVGEVTIDGKIIPKKMIHHA